MQNRENSWGVWLSKKWQQIYYYDEISTPFYQLRNLFYYLEHGPKYSVSVSFLGTLKAIEDWEKFDISYMRFEYISKCLEILIQRRNNEGIVKRIINIALKAIEAQESNNVRRNANGRIEGYPYTYGNNWNYAMLLIKQIEGLKWFYEKEEFIALTKQIIEAGKLQKLRGDQNNELVEDGFDYKLSSYNVKHCSYASDEFMLPLTTWAIVKGEADISKYLKSLNASLTVDNKDAKNVASNITPAKYLCDYISCVYEHGWFMSDFNGLLGMYKFVSDIGVNFDEAVPFFTVNISPNMTADSKQNVAAINYQKSGIEISAPDSKHPNRLRADDYGTYGKAIGEQNEYVKNNPNSAWGWAALGDSYMTLKNYPRAAEFYSRALIADPNYPTAITKLNSLLSNNPNVKPLHYFKFGTYANQSVPLYVEITPILSKLFFDTFVDARFYKVTDAVGYNICSIIVMDYEGTYSGICRNRKLNEMQTNGSPQDIAAINSNYKNW